jgi:hypothetical protein
LATTQHFRQHKVVLGGAKRCADSSDTHGHWPESP